MARLFQLGTRSAITRKGLVVYMAVAFSTIPLGWLLATRMQAVFLNPAAPTGLRAPPNIQHESVVEILTLDELISRKDAERLQQVTLSGPVASDHALQHVARFSQLASLEIDGGPISGSGLQRVAELPSLKRVDLRKADVSISSLVELQRARPDIHVLHRRLSERASQAFHARALRVAAIEERAQAGTLEPIDRAATEAIQRGLEFLASQQRADGRWRLQTQVDGEQQPLLSADVAATGLALLCLLGAGHDHQSDDFANEVQKGLDYLRLQQDDNGRVFTETDEHSAASVVFYSHAIATIAICEAYGMTGDEELREPAQRAIQFLEATQHRQFGGWRYASQVSSDTSVTGWAAMALKSAQSAELEVSATVLERLNTWLDSAQASEAQPHLYVYNPRAPQTPEQQHGRRPNLTMTSVGLLMRLYWGWKADGDRLQTGGEYLLANPPSFGERSAPQRDAYYWYYATQVLLHLGEDKWSPWKQQLFPLLCGSQQSDGSWDAENPTPDRWGPQAGRLYVTAMHLLSLEVEYRHLPIYQMDAGQ